MALLLVQNISPKIAVIGAYPPQCAADIPPFLVPSNTGMPSNRNETLSWFLNVPYLPYTSSVGGAERTWASEDECRKLD
jgi:hypothetical protein